MVDIILIDYYNVNMDIIQIQQELEKLYGLAGRLYEEEARAKAAYSSLKAFEKTKLALCMSEIFEGSEASKERLARASQEWRDWLQGYADSEKEYIFATGKVKSFEAKLEILRSLNKKHDIN